MSMDEWFAQKILRPMIASALLITFALVALGVLLAQFEPALFNTLLFLNLAAIVAILGTLSVLGNRLKMGLLQEKDQQLAQREQIRQLAHDLKSPLSVIRLIVDRGLASQEAVGLLKCATDKIINMVGELDVKSLIEKSTYEISVEDFFAELETLKQSELGSNNIAFNLSLAPALQGKVLRLPISRTHLHRMCSNLLNNALEATEGAGVVSCQVLQQNSGIKVLISNSGKQFPVEVLQASGQYRISAGKGDAHRRGFGLKHAFEQMTYAGGRMALRNVGTAGSEVEFSIPILQIATANAVRFGGIEHRCAQGET